MRRLTPLALLAALAVAGCGSKPGPRPIERATTSSATVSDPRGDAVDSDGNPRRGRPDVDILRVSIDRNADRALYTVTTGAKPRGPVEFEIFAQTSEVGGYDVVKITRDPSGVTGYVAFEDSAAKQMLSAPTSLSVNGPALSINVPIDPIFGGTPYEWRLSAKTGAGATISDYVPSPTGLKTFPAK